MAEHTTLSPEWLDRLCAGPPWQGLLSLREHAAQRVLAVEGAFVCARLPLLSSGALSRLLVEFV